MQRRNFFKSLLATTVATAMLPISYVQAKSTGKNSTIKPNRLKSGDTIGLIAPASNVWEDEEIHFATDVLKSFGFKIMWR